MAYASHMPSGLEEKARALADAQTEQSIDVDAERKWWIDTVDELYTQVSGWLRDLEKKKLVEISRTRIRLSEEHLGPYGIDALVLTFGPAAVVLRPMGRLIVGALGRLDMYRRGRRSDRPIMLILGGSKAAPQWRLWPSRDPRDAEALDAESFKAAVEALL